MNKQQRFDWNLEILSFWSQVLEVIKLSEHHYRIVKSKYDFIDIWPSTNKYKRKSQTRAKVFKCLDNLIETKCMYGNATAFIIKYFKQ